MLDYSNFKENYNMITIDLTEQQSLNSDPRAIQQINFTVNVDRVGNTTMFFIIAKAKETVVELLQRTIKIL